MLLGKLSSSVSAGLVRSGLWLGGLFLGGSILALVTVGSQPFWPFFLSHRIAPGISFFQTDLSALTGVEAEKILTTRYSLAPTTLELVYQEKSWAISTSDLGLRLDSQKLAQTAYNIGRSEPLLGSLKKLWQIKKTGHQPAPAFVWNQDTWQQLLDSLHQDIDVPPRDAQFEFKGGKGADQKGRVVVFVPSATGTVVDDQRLARYLYAVGLTALEKSPLPATVTLLTIPTKIVNPRIGSDQINRLGVVESLGKGESYFTDSIAPRVANLTLSANQLHGSLIAPGDTFSFNEAIGTVSAVFGYQKAYSIVKGKTILEDGGGVCQTTTTLYRAVLAAGLPVMERVAHSYRVAYYEQGGFLPGWDATVYPPSLDFRFQNDTGNWILIQTRVDPATAKAEVELFGKNDGRITTLTKPVILSTTPPPEPVYEDDPNLSQGQVKQVDTAHPGSQVRFTRKVTRDNEILVDEVVASNYIPWPARYLRGVKR